MSIAAYLNPLNPIYSSLSRHSLIFCDRVVIFSICLLAYFLPMSNAVISISFGIMFLFYLIKRSIILSYVLKQRVVKFSILQSLRAFEFNLNGFGPYVLLLGIAIFLSLALNGFPSWGFHKMFTRYFREILLFAMFLEVVNTRKRFAIVILTLLTSFAVISIDAVSQCFIKGSLIYPEHVALDRVTSAFSHANDLGAYLVTFLPVVIFLSFASIFLKDQGKWLYEFKIGKYLYSLRLPLLILVFLSTVALGFTFSRAAWLAFLACTIFLFQRKWKILFICLGVFAVLLMIFLPLFAHERGEIIRAGGNIFNAIFNIETRTQYWLTAFRTFAVFPIFGSGYGGYVETIRYLGLLPSEYPHNCYLFLLAEIGLFGLIAFGVLIGKLFVQSLDQMKFILDPFTSKLIICFLAGLVAYFVVSFFDTAFTSIRLSSLMWLMIAAVVALQKIETKGEI